MLPGLPPEFAALAARLQVRLPEVLGANLVGLYTYGTLHDNSFVSGRSDMDCIAVTEDPLDARAFRRLGDWLAVVLTDCPSAARLQMSLLVRSRVLEDDPSACLYQFGVLTRSGSDGNPIIWLDCLHRGHVLVGPDPSSFVPPITPLVLHDALVREVGYLWAEVCQKPNSEWRDRDSYRAYVVLTLCRILYTNATGKVASKSAAATWALLQLPEEFGGLLEAAERASREQITANLEVAEIARLINYVGSEIGWTPPSRSGV